MCVCVCVCVCVQLFPQLDEAMVVPLQVSLAHYERVKKEEDMALVIRKEVTHVQLLSCSSVYTTNEK